MVDNSSSRDDIWHALPEDEVRQQFDSGPDGLTDDQAQTRIEEYGKNELEAKEEKGIPELVVKELKSPLIYLLAAAAIISVTIGEYIEAGFIAVIVIVNTVLGVVQEFRAEKALAALREMSAPSAMVLRNGDPKEIRSSEIVPGDVLILQSGASVGADVRVIEGDDLEVDESALTGESEPVSKEPGELEEDAQLAERSNMAWMSTIVTNGKGRGLVVGTGMRTEMGKIADEVRETEREETPLQQRLGRLGKAIGVAGIVLAFSVFGLGLLRGYVPAEMVLFAVAVAVSAVPAGLPAVVSVTLALGVQRMADRNAIVRRLPSVEALGSTTVICSDKTGTITENQMTVKKMWAGGKTYEVTGLGYTPEGEIKPSEGEDADAESNKALDRLLTIGALANDARLSEGDGWHMEGDPTDGAILVASYKADYNPEQLEEKHRRLDEIPFSSDQKYMATLNAGDDNGKNFVHVKGAPERIMEFCTHILEDGERVELDDERRQKVTEANDSFAEQALRVMAGAYKEFEADRQEISHDDAESDLTFAGLWGMLDPPRESAVKAIGQAQEAGIHVVMLTGDHARTASAIAREVNIAAGDVEAVTGKEVENMSNEEAADAAMNRPVFARVSPSAKLKILEALKEKNEIVAMTGDGVNDAPALKGADIGIAMGETGTEVAREAADLVLTDDNFATIVHAVEEGRVIFRNLQNVTFFLITTSFSEILILVAALAMGLPLPLTAVMIVFINFMTDGASTVPLGVEPAHEDVLKEKPRHPDAPIVGRYLITRIIILGIVAAAGTIGMFLYTLQNMPQEYARAMAFTTLAAFQWVQAFNARSAHLSVFTIGVFSNRWVLMGVSVAIVLQILAVYTGIGQTIFGITALSLVDWGIIVLVALSLLVVDEILKRLNAYDRISGVFNRS